MNNKSYEQIKYLIILFELDLFLDISSFMKLLENNEIIKENTGLMIIIERIG